MVSIKLLIAAFRGRLIPALGAVLIAVPVGVWANTCPVSDQAAAENFIRDLHAQASAKLPESEMASSMDAFIRAKVPVDIVSRYALGIHWRRATDKQRAEYQKLFGETVFPGLSEQILRYRKASYMVVDNRLLQSNDRLVTANVKMARGGIMRVGWRIRVDDCNATATDMIVDGVSLMVMKRQEFASVIAVDGMDGLLEKMRLKAAQIKGGTDVDRKMTHPEMGQVIEELLRGAASYLP